MKAGILTFHRATNYGTALQAVATQKALEKLGVDAQIIDYRPQYIERTLKVRTLKDARSAKDVLSILVNAMIYRDSQKKKSENFLSFFEHMNVSDTICESVEEVAKICKDYDAVISGSDQLFNKNITGDDLTYFLPFEHKRKLSYASSFGESELSQQRIAQIAPYLCEFDYLSVREKTAHSILSTISDKYPTLRDSYSVLDPTMLVSRDEWIEYSDSTLDLPDKFILTYYMIETPLLVEITRKLKQDTKLPVVNLNPSKKQVITNDGLNLSYAGPAQLLECYKKASVVVTNSFHGTAFSINFNKPFYVSSLPVSMAGQVNSRLTDLLALFELDSRWIDSRQGVDSVSLSQLPDTTTKILSRLKDESFDYLKTSLNL